MLFNPFTGNVTLIICNNVLRLQMIQAAAVEMDKLSEKPG